MLTVTFEPAPLVLFRMQSNLFQLFSETCRYRHLWTQNHSYCFVLRNKQINCVYVNNENDFSSIISPHSMMHQGKDNPNYLKNTKIESNALFLLCRRGTKVMVDF